MKISRKAEYIPRIGDRKFKTDTPSSRRCSTTISAEKHRIAEWLLTTKRAKHILAGTFEKALGTSIAFPIQKRLAGTKTSESLPISNSSTDNTWRGGCPHKRQIIRLIHFRVSTLVTPNVHIYILRGPWPQKVLIGAD
jgi:hypothetical protein